MVAGGRALPTLVLVPADSLLRRRADADPLYPGQKLIRDMSAEEIRRAYVLYIGAGAVAAGRDHQPLPGDAADPQLASPPGLRDLGGSKRRSARHPPHRPRPLPAASSSSGRLALMVWPSGRALPLGSPWSLVGLAAAVLDRALRLPLRHGFFPVDGRDRLLVQSHLRHDHRHAAPDLPDLPGARLDRHRRPADRPDGGGRGVRSLVQRRHHLAGLEDRLPRRRHAQVSAMGDRHRRGLLGAGDRLHPLGC